MKYLDGSDSTYKTDRILTVLIALRRDEIPLRRTQLGSVLFHRISDAKVEVLLRVCAIRITGC